jgi:hypothetical protein
MVGPSKILTVSYGTFPCTLEGFDNPFGTMRGIAEYCRDLAAQDRYFGAEPPTPDADVLHRIAQSGVKQRIETRIEGNGVVLRQLDAADAPDQSARVEPAPAATVDEVATAADAAPVAVESVAAKLARIRAVVDDDAASGSSAFQDDEPVVSAFAGRPISSAFENVAEVEESLAPQNVPDSVEEETVQDPPEASEGAQTGEAGQTGIDVPADADEPLVTVEPEAEAEAEGETEVEVAVAAEVEAVAETAEPSGADPSAVVEDEQVADEASETDFALETAATDGAADSTDNEATDEATDEATNEAGEPVPEMDGEDETADSADLSAEEELSTEEVVSSGADDSADSVSQFMASTAAAEVELDEASEAEATEAPDDTAIARVVEMRNADFDDAEQDDSFAQAEQAGDTPQDVQGDQGDQDAASSTLSPEDEAELMANLDQVQRQAEAERRAEKEGRVLLETQDIESSANSVKRVLDVTNTELEESEGTRRRSAIAHLKAAVAATRADKNLNQKRDEEDAKELSRYRNDLARVVRPRRPSETSGKPAERKMPPLMLVSEQRVDLPDADPIAAAAAAAVRPRRVTSDNLAWSEDEAAEDDSDANVFNDGNSFAEFASEMGASELPDLLEAAAAYSSFVEGLPHFSLPHLMKTVATLKAQQEFTREEGLRSFGILLRRGKIKKIRRGQFQISATTRFNPEARIAGE